MKNGTSFKNKLFMLVAVLLLSSSLQGFAQERHAGEISDAVTITMIGEDDSLLQTTVAEIDTPEELAVAKEMVKSVVQETQNSAIEQKRIDIKIDDQTVPAAQVSRLERWFNRSTYFRRNYRSILTIVRFVQGTTAVFVGTYVMQASGAGIEAWQAALPSIVGGSLSAAMQWHNGAVNHFITAPRSRTGKASRWFGFEYAFNSIISAVGLQTGLPQNSDGFVARTISGVFNWLSGLGASIPTEAQTPANLLTTSGVASVAGFLMQGTGELAIGTQYRIDEATAPQHRRPYFEFLRDARSLGLSAIAVTLVTAYMAGQWTPALPMLVVMGGINAVIFHRVNNKWNKIQEAMKARQCEKALERAPSSEQAAVGQLMPRMLAATLPHPA